MSDRICLMKLGEIAELGTPDGLYLEPRGRFVAQFIGGSNLITGRMSSSDRLLIAGNRFIVCPATGIDRGSGVPCDGQAGKRSKLAT